MAGILLLCALIPFLGIFLPIPLVLVYVRYGGRTAVMTALVSALLTAMFKGPIQAFLITVPAGIMPGLVFGYGFRNKLRPLIIGMLAVLTFFASFGASYVVTRAAVLGGRDPIVDMVKPFEPAFEKMRAATQAQIDAVEPKNEAEAVQKKNALTMVTEMKGNFVTYTHGMLPSSLLLGGVLSAWINYLLCRATLPRFGHDVPAPYPFSRLRLPMWSIWVFTISSMAFQYVGQSFINAPWWVKTIQNVFMLAQMVFAVCGVAVIYGYFRIKKQMAKPPAVMLSLAPLMFGAIGLQVFTLGAMFDTIFDFRGLGHGLWRRPPEETP